MSNVTGGPNIVNNGLVFYMDASNLVSYTSGDTHITSLTGYITGNTTSVSFEPQFYGSWVFNGSNSNISCTPITEINNVTSLTFSFWGKKNGSGEVLGGNTIQDAAIDKVVLYWWLNGFVYFGARNGAANTSASYSLTYDTNWHYFVGVYEGGSTLKLYIDGGLVDTQVGVPATLSSNIGDSLTIGYVNNSNYSKGNISNVKIYNVSLSASEVQQNYNALKSRFGL